MKPRKTAVVTMSQCPSPGTACEASEPSTALDDAHRCRPAGTTSPVDQALALRTATVPEIALGRIEGRVVPTAVNADAPSSRMPGVESTAPPTPNAADSTPVTTPAPERERVA